MASDGEDDYLSDKFLLASAEPSASNRPLTYAERRKQALRQSDIKNVHNRKKSRRQLEEEAREEGLRRSLFERAKEEELELGASSKAMNMMLKMGFKPGDALGKPDQDIVRSRSTSPSIAEASAPSKEGEGSVDNTPAPDSLRASVEREAANVHRVVPLSLDIWSGKKGVGLGKRAPSPGASERLAKAARLGEEQHKESYRSRTREEYEERRAVGRIRSALRTLLTLDEKAGIMFNVLALDPEDVDTFPPELLEALSDNVLGGNVLPPGDGGSDSERLRRQMKLDALQTLDDPLDPSGAEVIASLPTGSPQPILMSAASIEEAKEYLTSNARERLSRVLHYLRERHFYCFWCGTQYSDKEDMDSNCPGEDEEAHD